MSYHPNRLEMDACREQEMKQSDRVADYLKRAAEARAAAEAMLDDQAKQTMIEAAKKWEALAVQLRPVSR